MQKCLHTRSSNIELILFLIFFLIYGVASLVCAAVVTFKDPYNEFNVGLSVCCLLLGLLFLLFGAIVYIRLSCMYYIDSQGFTISYLTEKRHRYLWKDVLHISVCDIDHAARNEEVFRIVIRITVEEEPYGPFSDHQPITMGTFERWRTVYYCIAHYKKVIILDYSPERLEKIKKVSGKEIYDFLTPRARKRGWYEDENGEHKPLPENF